MYADCFFDFIQKIKSNKSFQSVLWEKADLKIFEIQKVHIQISKKKKKRRRKEYVPTWYLRARR